MTLPRWTAPVGGVALAGMLMGLVLLQETTLHRIYFATGWVLVALLGAEIFTRWRRVQSRPFGPRWLGGHAVVGLVASVVFALHLEFRAPNGWLECVLAAMFLALVASGVAGLLLQRGLRSGAIDGERAGPRLVRRWLFVHVPLSTGVLCLGLLHGVLAHTHGLIAHLVLGKQ